MCVVKVFHRADPFAEFGLRAVALWARCQGAVVQRADEDAEFRGMDVDLVVQRQGGRETVKVKTDSYYGTDQARILDHDLPYYRRRADDFALETISHHITREPGWMFNSIADRLWYYQAVLLNPKDELERALAYDDEEMVAALGIEADRLRILDLQLLRAWFEGEHMNYPPRPVQVGDHISWYRIIPESDVERAVGRVETIEGLFSGA